MSHPSALHSTIALSRTYDSPASRVFAAITDPVERIHANASGEALLVKFDAADLRVGGRDIYRFGHYGKLQFHGEAVYHDIVRERRIVCTDIVYRGETRLFVGLTTFEFKPLADRCQLRLTANLAWLDGADHVEGADARFSGLLDALAHYLE